MRTLLVVLGFTGLSACTGAAQGIKPSQSGAVMQMVGDTRIDIRYNRPVARGRELFGSLVRWGRVWTPGADSATTIAFSRDVMVDGQPLAAGTYSLWMIPDPEEWTIVFNSEAHVFHTRYPRGSDVLRIQERPSTVGQHMETLTLHFPVVDGRHAVLAFQWGTTAIEIPIDIR